MQSDQNKTKGRQEPAQQQPEAQPTGVIDGVLCVVVVLTMCVSLVRVLGKLLR
jgi:hypothetical protein